MATIDLAAVAVAPAEGPTAGAEWGAHWRKVLSAMAGMAFYSMLTYHFGLFIQPLQAQFGWDRAAISVGFTIYTGAAFLLGPVIGMMLDRWGTRRIGVPGTALTALAVAALSLANGSIWQWYLLWAFVAAAALGVKSTVWSTGVSSLFSTSRSLALSVMLCGSALAQFLSPIIANAIIARHGWRAAYQWLGFGWGGLTFAILLLFFFDAHDERRRPTRSTAPVSDLAGLTMKQAMRSSQIIRIALANLAMSLVGAGVSVHMVPILTGTGIDRTTAAGMAALAGLAGLVGKLGTGWLLDRVQGNVVPFLSFAMSALGYALLMNLLHTRVALAAGVMVLGYTSGAGLQVTTYLCGRYAGMRNFGKVFAIIASMMMFGTAVGPVIAGAVYDHTGSYHLLLLAAMPVVVLASCMFIGLGPYPQFRKV